MYSYEEFLERVQEGDTFMPSPLFDEWQQNGYLGRALFNDPGRVMGRASKATEWSIRDVPKFDTVWPLTASVSFPIEFMREVVSCANASIEHCHTDTDGEPLPRWIVRSKGESPQFGFASCFTDKRHMTNQDKHNFLQSLGACRLRAKL